MADNVDIKTAANIPVATDEVGGFHYQLVKLAFGALDTATMVSVANPMPVTGAFYQATQPVSGTFFQATQPVSIASMPSTPVTGTFWQATQPVSLASTTVTGSVAVTGPVTDTQLRASAVPVSGAVIATPPVNSSAGPTTFAASDAVVGAPDGVGTLVSGASTAGSVVAIAVPNGFTAWTVLLKNWVNGTVYTEASFNSTNGTDGDWIDVKGRRTGTSPGVESVVYAMVSNGYYRGNAAGFAYFRCRFIGTTFPTVQISLTQAAGAVFLNSGIPGGSSSIGSVTTVDATASGSLAGAAQVVTLALAGQSAAAAQITGTWAGTITFEGSLDGTTWNPINAVSASTSTPQTTTTVNGLYRITPAGLQQIRVNMSAFTSGSATVLLRGSVGTGGVFANQILPTKNTDGVSVQALKAASTAAAFTDAAAVVDIRPGGVLAGMGAVATTGDTGAKTATGNGATVANSGNKGVQIVIAIGTVTGITPTAVFKVQTSVDGGTNWVDLPGATTASLVATGNWGITIYPGQVVTAGTTTTGTTATANGVIPRSWRMVWTLGGTTPSFTINSITYNYLPN